MNKKETQILMDRMLKHKEAMQGFINGKEIEYKSGDKWCPVIGTPVWEFHCHDYRIKKGPREFWVNIYNTDAYVYETKSDAETGAVKGRIDCIKVRQVDE